MNNIQKIKEIIKESDHIVLLTGAGISTESGIPDYRSGTGVWTIDQNRTNYMSKHYFQSKPKAFWKIYKEIFGNKMFSELKPNTGHQYIANLEKEGKRIDVFTQNVDGLHQQAGSPHVFEVHGNNRDFICPKCKKIYDRTYIQKHDVPRCEKENHLILRPDTVLFGDPIRHYKEAEDSIRKADLFMVIGTSLQVGPINELPKYAWRNKIENRVLINREPTEKDQYFNELVFGEIGDIVAKLSDNI